MKTIILHNWLSVGDELKNLSLLTLLTGIGIFGFVVWQENTFLIYPFLGIVASLSLVVPLTVQEKDTSCQWERFSLTLPISRKDIVTGQFYFFIQITALIFGFTLGTALGAMALTQSLEFAYPVRLVDILIYIPLSISLGFVGQSFVYLLTLIGKDTTAKIFHFWAVLVGAGPYLISLNLCNGKSTLENALLSCLCTTVLSAILMGVIYVVAVKLIEKKEF